MNFDPRVTIVVLTHDRPKDLERVVLQLRMLAENPRIIIVDNGSKNGVAVARLGQDRQVTVVRSEKNLGAAGRNIGVDHVLTPYVAFCDDDTAWQPGALRRACDLLDDFPQVGVINGKVLVGPCQVEDPACTRMLLSPLNNTGLPGPALISFMAGATIMRARAYRQAHGYEPRLFIGAEETLMSLNLAALGWRMVYIQDVIIHHLPSPARDAQRRTLLTARNRMWVAWLRLPWQDARHHTYLILKRACSEGKLWHLLWISFKGWPWAVLHRRVVPDVVADMHREVFAPAARRCTAAPETSKQDMFDSR